MWWEWILEWGFPLVKSGVILWFGCNVLITLWDIRAIVQDNDRQLDAVIRRILRNEENAKEITDKFRDAYLDLRLEIERNAKKNAEEIIDKLKEVDLNIWRTMRS